MIIDGQDISKRVYTSLKKRIETLGRTPVLSILTCNPTFESNKYIGLKKVRAQDVGIKVSVHELNKESETKDFEDFIKTLSSESDGIIVQLPIPEHINLETVLSAIPPDKDVDAINPRTKHVLSPVVGAIVEILQRHNVDVNGKNVIVIGKGRLVGKPAARWLRDHGANVRVVTKSDGDISAHTKEADIIVSGAGVPGLLTPDTIKDGAVILDAGTSEDMGELTGDALPSCAVKASLFTPVPGGIGPVTVAILLNNVVRCAERNSHVI